MKKNKLLQSTTLTVSAFAFLALFLFTTPAQAQTADDEIKKAKLELNKMAMDKQVKTQQNKWSSADETTYKQKVAALSKKIKDLEVSKGAPAPAGKNAEAIKAAKLELNKLAMDKQIKTQQDKWSSADEEAYKKKVADLNKKIKDLQAGN